MSGWELAGSERRGVKCGSCHFRAKRRVFLEDEVLLKVWDIVGLYCYAVYL